MTPETSAAIRYLLTPETPEAALIWEHLAVVCHTTETSHTPGDPLTTAFNEGKRAVFLNLAGALSRPIPMKG